MGGGQFSQDADCRHRAGPPRTEEFHGQIVIGDIQHSREFLAAPVIDAYGDRTRPNLKVQDGCSNKCSFCIIPSVRGLSRSAPLASIVEQVHGLAERYREVVLSGINLGRWGRDLPGGLRFPDLLRAVLQDTPVQRIRISSVEPMDWSAELLELMAGQPRIAPHVHIPLQSGSDTVLKRMFRKYRTRHYASRPRRRAHFDAGRGHRGRCHDRFPGETDAEFNETVRFIEDRPFTYLHVFTYSERPGTHAARLTDQVPVSLRRERTAILRELSDRKNADFRRRMVGRTLSAVTLSNDSALTGNFLRVQLAAPRVPNEIIDIEIGAAAPGN